MARNLSKRLFIVTRGMNLDETTSPMRPDQRGFAYVPLGDPVEIEIDTVPYTVARSAFQGCTKWQDSA